LASLSQYDAWCGSEWWSLSKHGAWCGSEWSSLSKYGAWCGSVWSLWVWRSRVAGVS